MSTRKNIFRMCFAAALAAGLTACGGGGTKKVVNTAPSLTLDGAAAIDEGTTGTTGLAVSATDAQGNDITLTVSDPRFGVVGGVLTVVAGTVLDYEKESSITVSITADDGELSDTKTATVSVGNVDDNELTLNIFGTRGSIVEGDTGGTGLTFMADDNDGLDNLTFTTSVEGFSVLHLGGDRYELQVDTALDREALDGGTVSVVVTATDGSGSMMTPTLTIAVGNKDDTKPALGAMGTGTIDENGEGDTGITFRPTDADGDALFSFFLGGTDRTHFTVVPAGFQTYALQVSDSFDYEDSGGTVSVTVTVVDSSGMHDEATFEVTVEDVNDNAPVITTTGAAAIDEEQMGSTGLMVGTTDVDTVGDAVTWSVDNDRFSIDADGYLTLAEGFDYDGDDGVKSVTVNVTANDGANDSMPQAVTVTINAVNDNTPEIAVDATAKMDKAEGTFAAATSTGVTVSVTDGDGDTVTPTVSGDSRFAIDATGNLVIAAGSTFDYETDADKSIMLTIMANDGMHDAMSQSVTVMFTDENDSAPMLAVTDNKGGTAVTVVTRDEGTVSANTPTDHKIVVSDADTHDLPTAMVSDDRFMIDANGYLTIKGGSVFDFETAADKSIALEISADDGTNAKATYTITFNIANVDERPVITGEANPTLVMGPRGDGQKNVTTLKAVDPDNPNKSLPSVEWTVRTNPTTSVWSWTPNSAGDEFSLGMAAGTFLGDGGPAAGSYTGYTADDAKTLARHVVDADDAELDAREVVRPKQIVDTITTSEHLATYRTYSVKPTKAHVGAATNTEEADGKPGTESFIPRFGELTDGPAATDVIHPSSTVAGRLLTDAEIHAGIGRSTLGGTNYAKAAAGAGTISVDDPNDTAYIANWYDTNAVSPSNAPPVEPAGLDIVTDTRTVDMKTADVAKGQQLAIRYRFTKDANLTTAGDQPGFNDDVALIDGSGMVQEEYRDADAYVLGDGTSIAQDGLTATTASFDVNVTAVAGNANLNYALYGLWAYNDLRKCSVCPDDGLRGATAFGLKARAGDLNGQDHVGIWEGSTHAFWGTEESDGSIDPADLNKGDGNAQIAVNFANSKVQANMHVTNGADNAHIFVFEGALDSGKLGYTARLDTTVPGGKGEISGPNPNSTPADTWGVLSTGDVLAKDSNNNIHAKGTLTGAFYGPRDAAGSTVANAKASAETAGTWTVADVPNVLADDKRTVVIGAFGADLTSNGRLSDLTIDTDRVTSDDSNYKFID